MKFKISYELKDEDENGNTVWTEMTIEVRERSAELARIETVYHLQDSGIGHRNVRNA
jgi:hypothetical protein